MRPRSVSDAIEGGSGQAINYFIAQKYVEALGKFATSPNAKTILFPVEATQLIGTLGGIGELAREAFGEEPARPSPPAAGQGRAERPRSQRMNRAGIDPGWLWLIGGVVLLIAEVIAPGFFLVFIGAAAIATGLFTVLFDLGVAPQLALVRALCRARGAWSAGASTRAARRQHRPAAQRPGADGWSERS